MTNLAIIGTQWGDEGKGKVVDLLAEGADLVVRFQGGNNAGHTLVVGDETYALHLVPSGILHEEKTSVIGSGVVVDPAVLLEEIDALVARGVRVSPKNLRVSEKAHVVLPYHKLLDEARESRAKDGKIGTTGRGIGPAYEDKASRCGLRLGDLRDLDYFRSRAARALDEKNCLLTGLYGLPPVGIEQIMTLAAGWRERLVPYLCDAARLVQKASEEKKNVLFEGAQGVQLDVDHGTYPYVTSSNPTAGAVAVGAGLPPRELHAVVGLVKAYTSRVGEGPFPTELSDRTGETIRAVGREYGTTTGRPRRCGWLDAVVVRAAVRLCGIELLAVTKLDVLAGLPELKIAVAYELDGRKIDHVPASLKDFSRVRPVYESFEGFSAGEVAGARDYQSLPQAAKKYLAALCRSAGAKEGLVSVGPERSQTIVRHKFF
ncbi:MAG: adenylosuccinate synthase [Deltaproteobacteria bacterium]|jgi:adenylosuccinate synthase|nr:adenylosuccinate synthase [Deltaproteobacteria bacterium]